jgi:enamine deaminase RidA (YjgF/YER057c/UK114 family)
LPTPCGIPAPCGARCKLSLGSERHAVVDLGSLTRLAVVAVPASRGSVQEQAEELFAQVLCLVKHQPVRLMATSMTVFLRNSADEPACEAMIRRFFGDGAPVTTFVTQPPCCGAALGVELWTVGGPEVRVEQLGPHVLAVESEGIRWIHCAAVRGFSGAENAYGEALLAFRHLEQELAAAGVDFDQVVRTWIYVNQITAISNGRQRYQELNGARADFFHEVQFGKRHRAARAPETIYPASTGIGTSGTRITMSCLALDSERPDVFLLPLENPLQTPAYNYQAKYSPQAPRFSRAMAVVQGHFITTLVSGTASIVNAETRHPGDIVRQTEQAIENIERLIAPDNFARAGLAGAGAALRHIAKLRVYVKHQQHCEACRAVCERRLPRVPAIYLLADICRPDLLVEIEAVAFSPFRGSDAARRSETEGDASAATPVSAGPAPATAGRSGLFYHGSMRV